MGDITNENQLTLVKEYEFKNPLITKIDSLIDNSIRDCHHNYFHTFDHVCEYDLNFTISDESMGMYELNEKLIVARRNGYIFNQIKNFKIKIYSNLSNINIHYHLKLGASPIHRQFFIKISQNRDYIQTFCNDRRNTFHFACRQWYSYNNPGILT